MNRIFNIIWSRTKEKWIVVSEKVKGNGKVPSSPLRSLAALTAFFAAGGAAYAIDSGSLPTGGQITSGSGTIATSGTQMTVNQSSQQLIANWNTFNIGENAAVRFNQPNSSAAALNRIFDQNPSQIMGSLSSNGQVFLLNPSGIIFGRTARVDVGGLVASSLNMLDSDFLAGKYTFTGNSSSGALLNQGVIKARDGGVVALLAPKVTNEGSVTANSGSILLAAGNKVSLDFTGDGLISFTVDQGAVDALVENKGFIKADGGVVVMTARAADVLRMATATNSGVIEARTIQNKAGRILLLSDMQNGQTTVSGTLDASAPDGGNGGFIETSGGRVMISDGTIVTTLAPQGKSGRWLIDPTNFTISSGSASQTVSGIGAATLETALGGGDVTIATSNTANGTDLGDINVNADVTWSVNMLTLTAHHDININAVMKANNASLVLNYGWNGLGEGAETYGASGNLNMGFNPDGTFKGRVDFFKAGGVIPRSGTGFLTINNHGYTVITDLGLEGSLTGKDLQGINSGLGGYYALGSNIDASQTASWNSDKGFMPIGSSGSPFTGAFDGLGHIIDKLTINRPDLADVGLFGNAEGTIRNVGLVDASITGKNYVGGLVGRNFGDITNSYATGSVTGGGYEVGGLVGLNYGGTITSSYAKGSVVGNEGDVGGLVGYNFGDITSSYATGSVNGNGDDVGGLVGFNYGGTITSSYATGSVVGNGDYCGGLAGYNHGTITNSYATGSVEGNGNYVGGLAGYNDGSIDNSHASGEVTGWGIVGGLVGYNHKGGTITSSYASGNVTGSKYGVVLSGQVGDNYSGIPNFYATGSLGENGNFVGGLVGDNYGAISNSYATGNVTANGVTSRFVGGLVGYCYGSISNSYATGNVVGSGNYVGGLAGLLHHSGTISNSYATGSVEGNSYVGGLVGLNWSGGTIANSYATGSVTGNNYVGGLVGDNHGTIANSYAAGSVTGSSYVGGLVGYNYGTIEKSYARGRVSGGNYTGALVGYDDGNISHSFYEKDANPLLTGVGNYGDEPGYVYGMSTANMKLLANFTEATAANGNVNPGWDFTTPVWKIDPANNGGYPYLSWQTFSSGLPSKPYERPVLSEPLPVTGHSYQGAPIAPPPPLVPEGQLLEAKIVSPPSRSAPGLILVIVPQFLIVPGSVFSFVLPEEVKSAVSESGVAEKVTLLDGSPLPAWLHYSPETMTFTATDMPRGVTELKVLVMVGGKRWIVDITMQQAP